MKPAYKVVVIGYHGEEDTAPVEIPKIIMDDITDTEGTDWRTAKKQLREWYLNKAAELRTVTEKSYFS